MSTALVELTRIWDASGASKVVTIPERTELWHCGRIPSIAHLDGSRALWTTRNRERSDVYAGFAREPASWTKHLPTKLEFIVKRELRAADFALQSLLEFTRNHCSCQHEIMKRTLHAWMKLHNFDAVVRLNRDADEVVVARPTADLHLVSTFLL